MPYTSIRRDRSADSSRDRKLKKSLLIHRDKVSEPRVALRLIGRQLKVIVIASVGLVIKIVIPTCQNAFLKLCLPPDFFVVPHDG